MRRADEIRFSMILALAVLAGCGGEAPVGTVAVEPSSLELPYPEAAGLKLTWRPGAELDAGARPVVFVHLLDSQGEVARTFDHPYPESWRPGSEVSYDVSLYQSALAPPLAPGTYRLTLGLYQPQGERWPLAVPGREVEDVGSREYAVATVEVPAPEPSRSPDFRFTGEWLDLEPGADRQILARRWLAGAGDIEILGVRGGRLMLGLTIPPAEGGGGRLVLEEGAPGPAVVLHNECIGDRSTLSGPGPHRAELTLPARPAGAGGCTVRLEPNFHLLLPTLERRTVSLDVVAWRLATPS